MKIYLLVLVSSAVVVSSAHAGETLCSGKGTAAVRMEIADKPEITIEENGHRVIWKDAGSVSADMPGRIYQNADGQSEVLQTATVVNDAKTGPEQFRLFQDRAFWPCPKS